MIYLDGDIEVFHNIDHLFDMPNGYFYAVMDCFCQKTWSHSKQFEIGYCQQCPNRGRWPSELGPKPPLLCTSMPAYSCMSPVSPPAKTSSKPSKLPLLPLSLAEQDF
ncbi:hypothetical protein RJ639_029483 [Escallonia herrerae]|uniref:Hexosyltransferase n=1 Tax=Escallonia herrerae TaxID=1293975 RepID=A0AA88QMT1_9ASTE|nr:hypothetical protein RJ639_029483 [Escallonia herrerae]